MDLGGAVIREYEVLERIGVGGCGAVYRARQPKLNREVAIKVLLPELANEPAFIRQLEGEALLVARLEHPHIVPIYDFWRDDNGAYLVMRWLRGGSLRAAIERGPLSNQAVMRIMDQVCSALAAAHRVGVAHRDLKPDNVLLDEDGNAYLTDFGIAIHIGDRENTDSDLLVGTMAYMSPEQVVGNAVTTRTDIYSLGLMAFELLTGEHPFAGKVGMELLTYQLERRLPSLLSGRADLPSGLDDVLARATAKNVAERHMDALGLAAALHQHLSPELQRHNPVARLYDRAELLPGQHRKLIGRDALLRQIYQALDEQGRVLLHGFGGIGKTALATAVAEQRLQSGDTQVLWLDAGADKAELLLEAVDRGLSHSEALPYRNREEQLNSIRRQLLATRPLVVLDNVWNDRALFQLLAAFPAEVPVLVTSRHALPLDGALLDIRELSSDDALRLLDHYAGRLVPRSGALALCQRVGYHTFALEIAGKMLKVEPRLTPERLLQRIADSPHDLRVPGSFADVGRESVKDLYDASLQELSESSQHLFVTLGGLFAPRASVQLVALACGRSAREIEPVLLDLQQRGLLTFGYGTDDAPDHCWMHDLTFSYVRALYRSSAHDHRSGIAAVRAYVRACTESVDLLDFEKAQIFEAAQTASTEGDVESLVAIMIGLAVESSYFAARGFSQPALHLLHSAVSGALDRKLIEPAHYLLSKLGNAYANYVGDLDQALDAYQEAARLSVLMNDHRRQALLLSAIGTVRARQGAEDAGTYLTAAYRLAKNHNDDVALSQVLEHMGYQAAVKADHTEAQRYYGESLQVAERLQNPERLFFALTNLGAAEQGLGDFQAALGLNQRAYDIACGSGEMLWMAYALECIGESHDGLQNRAAAQRAFERAVELFCQLGANVRLTALVELMERKHYSVPQLCAEQGSIAREKAL